MRKQIKDLVVECARCVQELATDLDAMDTTVTESKKAVIFNLELRLCRMEFVLTVKNSMMCPMGTLFARVFPQKNRPLNLHLYELMAEDDFRCCYFTYNASVLQLQHSFSALKNLVLEVLPVAEELALDNERYEQVLAEKCTQLAEYANVDTAPLKEQLSESELQEFLIAEWGEFYETFAQLLPFTQNEAYAAFVAGDIKKAVNKFGKMQKKAELLPYFERLYRFLQTPQAHRFQPFPPACRAAYLQGREVQYGAKEGARIFGAAGILYGIFLVFFYLISGGVYALLCGDAVYAPYDWVFVLFLPLLPALFGSIALRRWLYPKLFRMDAQQWLAQDELGNAKAINAIAYTLFAVCGVACLWFAVVFTLSAPQFYTDRMVYDDGAKFPFLNWETYHYEDIDSVNYIEGRYNAYEEYIDRGSYVLVFEDGSVVDLDSSISIENTEENMLPLLTSYVDEVKIYPSDRDLAEAYGKDTDSFFNYGEVVW